MRLITRVVAVLPVMAVFAVFVGCSSPTTAPDKKAEANKNKEADKTTHEEWWCAEHGIPEDECIMCSAKKKEDAKSTGDWCKHNRAKSQCFACDPKLKEEYAAKYRAKNPGKEPPAPTEND